VTMLEDELAYLGGTESFVASTVRDTDRDIVVLPDMRFVGV
jgi:hypothetical protein